MTDNELDQAAIRCHLRDNERLAKARAFNLLTEDVMEPLRLAFAALDRDKPKIESAKHQIELAIDSIIRDIKYFE